MVDNMRHHVESWDMLFKEMRRDIDTAEFIRSTAGRTSSSLLREILGPHAAPEEIERLASRKEELYRDHYRPHLKPIPGLREILALAKTSGIKCGIGSSGRKANIDFVLDGLAVRSFFEVVVGAQDVAHAKPDPEMFLKAAAVMKIKPRNCWVFEDAKAGLDAARAAGMPAVLVAFDPEARKLTHHPAVERVIHDFTELIPEFSS